jgi:hypothetical protein
MSRKFATQLSQAMQAVCYEPKPAVLEGESNTRHWGTPMLLHGVRLWLLGETMPEFKKLEMLLKWLGVPVQQLGYGGETARAAAQRRTSWDSGIGYEDRDVFDAYFKLPVPQCCLICETILSYVKVNGDVFPTSG